MRNGTMTTGTAPCSGQWGCAAAARSRAALTLVELLAVIAIIGLLMGLLLPAVQSARESARRVACASTLRQWGQAIQSYEQSNAVLPLGLSEYRCVMHSWLPPLWAYIDQLALTDRYVWTTHEGSWPNVTAATANPPGARSVKLPIYYCPSGSPNATEGNAPRVNYVANATDVNVGTNRFRGPFRRRVQDGGCFQSCGPSATDLACTPGISWVPIDTRGYTGPRSTRVARIVDGLSNTLMMAEVNVLPGETTAGGPTDPRGTWQWSFFSARFTPNSAFDLVASWFVPPNYQFVNRPPAMPCQATGTVPGNDFVFAARSSHAAGAQAMMCDGSVRFVSDLVDQAAWQAQGTMSGREAITSND